MSVCLNIWKNTQPNLCNVLCILPVECGCGSVFLWWCCELCTSGFVITSCLCAVCFSLRTLGATIISLQARREGRCKVVLYVLYTVDFIRLIDPLFTAATDRLLHLSNMHAIAARRVYMIG